MNPNDDTSVNDSKIRPNISEKESSCKFTAIADVLDEANISRDLFESDDESGLGMSSGSSPSKKRKKSCQSAEEKPTKMMKTGSTNSTLSRDTSRDTVSTTVQLSTTKSENKENIEFTDTFDNLDDFFSEAWSENSEKYQELDLTIPTRCKIVTKTREKINTNLTVKEESSGKSSTVTYGGLWASTQVNEGDDVIIKAAKDPKDPKMWIVDNNHGFIVTQPNTLIAGTSVVSALFCNRRSVFVERFRGIESLPYHETGSHYMLTGTLCHELLQYVLENKIYLVKEINEVLDKLLKSRATIDLMYDANISYGECRNLMKPFVPQIFRFVRRYIQGVKTSNTTETSNNNYTGKISEICDIEENMWVPELGLKGKIDLTVKVLDGKKDNFTPQVPRMLPLEVKTGRASFSAEHKGQLILYTMMMNMTERKTDSGLLLYLKENILQEMKGSSNEQRDLIMLRNQTAYYTTRQPTVIKENGNEKILPMELPDPISHFSCAKCPYNVLCCSYLKDDNQHPIRELKEKITSHLTQEHIDYVLKWVSLMQLEENTENVNMSSWKDVWLMQPEEREKQGTCAANVELVSVTKKHESFVHLFKKPIKDSSNMDLSKTEFVEKEYVIISTSKRCNISSAFVDKVTDRYISLTVCKDITKVYDDIVFHIDKSESNSLLTTSLAQLGGLLDDNIICQKLREIIIDRRPAKFTTKIPSNITRIVGENFKMLNEKQQLAVLKVLQADDFILIKGFPGTGKTETLVALIEFLIRMNKSVIVTAHTNTAIDNILLKLLKHNIDFIRFGSVSKMHPDVVHKSDEILTANCDTPESLHTAYCSKKVVAVTCYSTSHPHFSRRKFDVCVVDESTQVLQPITLRPLYCASKFVLVGDPEQLPPIAKNKTARKLGINESLFARLDSKNNTVTLTKQYRMNQAIMNVANNLTYDNQLQVGNNLIANSSMPVSDKTALKSSSEWVKKTLSLDLKYSAIMLDTSATYHLDIGPDVKFSNKICNPWEASIAVHLIEVLISMGIKHEDIGLISPYRAQVNLFRRLMDKKIEVNTVDQYQGRDKSIIIFSCTKSSPPDEHVPEFSILLDQQRLTVAVTRAKHKLILIGDYSTLIRYSPFSKLLKYLKENDCLIHLKNECDFDFEDLKILLSTHQT